MSRMRLILAHLAIAGVIGGSFYDIVMRQEHWPFSNYPMFSSVHRQWVLRWPRLYGVTPEGYAVRGTGGAPLVLQSGRGIDIATDGSIRQDGADAGRLEIVAFAGTAGISKQGNNYFRVIDAAAARPGDAAGASVEQGKLEASNTGSAESAVRLVSVMRQFEMLQKAVALGGEMNRAAIEQVAKVGN